MEITLYMLRKDRANSDQTKIVISVIYANEYLIKQGNIDGCPVTQMGRQGPSYLL